MKNRDGAWMGAIGGSIYVPLVFWLPPSRIWLYPLMFALPTLLVGLLALSGGVPTVLAIGFSTFLVGMTAAYLGQYLARLYRPRSNPSFKRDALKRAPYSNVSAHDRTATLTALVKVTMPIPEAISRLAEFSWDSKSELVHLTSEDFCHVLSLFKQGSLSAAEIEDWANALECRDDVGFSTSQVRELLHELANPLLTQPLSSERANFLLSELPHVR